MQQAAKSGGFQAVTGEGDRVPAKELKGFARVTLAARSPPDVLPQLRDGQFFSKSLRRVGATLHASDSDATETSTARTEMSSWGLPAPCHSLFQAHAWQVLISGQLEELNERVRKGFGA